MTEKWLWRAATGVFYAVAIFLVLTVMDEIGGRHDSDS
jgi:hypothetical protein